MNFVWRACLYFFDKMAKYRSLEKLAFNIIMTCSADVSCSVIIRRKHMSGCAMFFTCEHVPCGHIGSVLFVSLVVPPLPSMVGNLTNGCYCTAPHS